MERKKLTDYQAFRLFLVGKADQNPYRKISVNWWMRNMPFDESIYFDYSGSISGNMYYLEATTRAGVLSISFLVIIIRLILHTSNI